ANLPWVARYRVAAGGGTGVFVTDASYVLDGITIGLLAPGDVDGDGDVDQIATTWWSDSILVMRNDGTGSFGSRVAYPSETYLAAIALGDLDGDGDLDLVAAGKQPSVMLNSGNGVFVWHRAYPMDVTQNAVALGDFDGD